MSHGWRKTTLNNHHKTSYRPPPSGGYNAAVSSISENFNGQNVPDITALDVQAEINRLAKNRSPKTVRNYHGFISSVLGAICPNLKICTTLPQKVRNEPYIPSDEDVRKILKHAGGTEYEIPLILACYGLRRSEICALTLKDLDGDIIRIDKAKVLGEDGSWTMKTTKATASTREIIIPARIADKIREQGYIYKGHPNSITRYLESAEDALWIPRFPLHKLRHYFASKISALNIPEADIMRMEGWETDYVMKSVYRHAMEGKKQGGTVRCCKEVQRRDIGLIGQNPGQKTILKRLKFKYVYQTFYRQKQPQSLGFSWNPPVCGCFTAVQLMGLEPTPT